MGDLEQKSLKQERPAASNRVTTREAGASDNDNFNTFHHKQRAMQEVLRTIAARRVKRTRFGDYRNPWWKMSEEQINKYTQEVIKQLKHLRYHDLQVGQALFLQGQEGDMLPQERIEALQRSLERLPKREERAPGVDAHGLQRENDVREAIEGEIALQKAILNNRKELIGDGEVGPFNGGILFQENGEKAGYVRVYMTVFAPAADGSRKDLRLSDGKFEGVSDRIWLNFASPARAISYVHNYRLQSAGEDKMDAMPLPVVRSVLVPTSFLKKHLPQAVTEDKREQAVIDNWWNGEVTWKINKREVKAKIIKHMKSGSLMNVDLKVPGQYGLLTAIPTFVGANRRAGDPETLRKRRERLYDSIDCVLHRASADTDTNTNTNVSQGDDLDGVSRKRRLKEKRKKRASSPALTIKGFKDGLADYGLENPTYQEFLRDALAESFTTFADPNEFTARANERVDGKVDSLEELANQIGLAGPIRLLRGGGEKPATIFSIRRTGNKEKWKSPSNAELGKIVEHANGVFDRLDNLPHDEAFGELTVEANLAKALGDLLEGNRLTPGSLLSGKDALRDRNGNSAMKSAFEAAFAEQYRKSDIWRGDMARWSLSLANAIDEKKLKQISKNIYIKEDMEALNGERGKDAWSTPVEVLKAWSERLRTERPGQNERHVDLFFHLLRELAARMPTSKDNPAGSKPFTVNNRIRKTVAFDIINPLPGPYPGPADPMRSTNRFRPDPARKENEMNASHPRQ